jgi:diadenosine tetraphosphatase ApaH/serine/threonine PP2A family protein phosphatase
MELEIIKKRLRKVTKSVFQIFNSEPAVIKITGSTTIVGDIHGNLDALDMILEEWQKSSTINILFLGDYVDRGSQSAECLLTLFELKVVDPTHVFLLRGNHEDQQMNRRDGFYNEIKCDNTFLTHMHSIYETMPVAAILDDGIFCVHGGIPDANSIDTITKDNSYQYLWNDPSDVPGITDSERGFFISNYGPDIVDVFLAKNNLKRIIRAHEFQEKGYKFWFDRKLLSLFSSFNYCGKGNKGAYAEYKDKKLDLYVINIE